MHLESIIQANCIFAHQEFRGCRMGGKISEKGDIWNPEFPLVISGHIHDSQTIGENIQYVGSPIQHSFGETLNKSIWFVTFDELEKPEIEKINLKVKPKKIIHLDLEGVKKFDTSELEKFNIKIKINCTYPEFKSFRQSLTYSNLYKQGVKMNYCIRGEKPVSQGLKTRDEVSYFNVLKQVVKEKNPEIQNQYQQIVGDL